MRKLTNFVMATAIVLTSVSLSAAPAEARGRHGGWGHGGWGHRDRDNISTGDVLGGLLIVGTIAAIASSLSKDKRERQAPDYRAEPQYRDGEYRDVPSYEPEMQNGSTPGAYGRGEAEARASDACSWAVEGEMGDDARVETITDPRPDNGGWYVTGTASRASGDVRSFGCRYAGGRVVDVNFGG